MSTLVLAACQPLPAGVIAEFKPGHAVFACPPATSWWTPLHIWYVAAAVLVVLCILALIAAAIWDGFICPPAGQVTVRQWFRLPKAERDWRTAEFRAADEALQINGEAEDLAGIAEETGTYLVLNGRVNDLWPTVPWWCRR